MARHAVDYCTGTVVALVRRDVKQHGHRQQCESSSDADGLRSRPFDIGGPTIVSTERLVDLDAGHVIAAILLSMLHRISQ